MRRRQKSDQPNPIDIHVGSRVRLQRMSLGLSQAKLGDGIGLTFQQVQKYERGANRIGASKLWEMADILDVPVQFFFEEVPKPAIEEMRRITGIDAGCREDPPEPNLSDPLARREVLELVRAYCRIDDQAVRHRLFELARTLATPTAIATQKAPMTISPYEVRATNVIALNAIRGDKHMIRLVFVSAARAAFQEAQLSDLLAQCRRNNANLGVTGTLFYAEGNFMAAVEGNDQVVDALIAKIAQDPRHHRVRTLYRGAIAARQFSNLPMALWRLSDLPEADRASCISLVAASIENGATDGPAAAMKLLKNFPPTIM